MKMAYVNQHFELFNAYKRAHPELRPQQAQINTNIIWNGAKKEYKRRKPDFTEYIRKVIDELNREFENREAGIEGYTPQIPYIPPLPQGTVRPQPSACSFSTTPLPIFHGAQLPTPQPLDPFKDFLKRSSPFNDDDYDCDPRRKYSSPTQDSLKNHIALLESELNSATLTRNSGLGGPEIDSKIDQLCRTLYDEQRKLARVEENAKRQKTFRVKRKSTLSQILSNSAEVVEYFKVNAGVDLPLLHNDEEPPETIKVALELARLSGYIDMKKCQELKRCKTTEELDKEFVTSGLHFQKCGNYLRVLPVGVAPEHVLRTEISTPVRLCHAMNKKEHVDHKFSTATSYSLDSLATIMGARQVAVVHMDCQAKVPLAISAAGRHVPLLMRMEYHDSPEQEHMSSSRNKLNLSVYAGVTLRDEFLDPSDSVGFCGPTYVAVRLGKHFGPSSPSNAVDLERLMWLPSFQEIMRVDGQVKPVFMLHVNGGPDESPKYSKTISSAVEIFKKYDLDALFISICVPGKPSTIKVERRLASLSREIFGILLPHDPYGSHLNDSGVIVDDEMESRNYQYAARVLCENWNRFVIDGHSVVAEMVAHKGEDTSDLPRSQWYSNHIRESQYLLQIIKCNDPTCCTPMRCNLKNILPNGFLPAPYPLKRTPDGLKIINPSEVTSEVQLAPLLTRLAVDIKPGYNSFAELPYDLYCPSLQSQIADRICCTCGLYFASKKNVVLHSREVHKLFGLSLAKVRPRMILSHRRKELLCLFEDQTTGAQNTEWVESEDVDLVGLSIPEPPQTNVIPIIGEKLNDWIQFPWIPDI